MGRGWWYGQASQVGSTWKDAGWLELGVALGLARVLHQPGTLAEGAPGGKCSSPISTEPPNPMAGSPSFISGPSWALDPRATGSTAWVGPC